MDQLEKAIEYLKKGLQEKRWSPGDRLPGVKKLGRDAKISHIIMGKAVHHLSTQGELEVIPNSGTRVPYAKGYEPKPAPENEKKWKKVRSRIVDDLLIRVSDESRPMASLQELRNHYATSYPVLKKALGSLEDMGILTLYKKTYKPAMFLGRGPTTKILVLLPVIPQKLNKNAIGFLDKGFDLSSRGLIFIKKIEHLCNTQNLGFDIWGYYSQNNSTTYLDSKLNPCNSIDNFKHYYGICLLKTLPFSHEFSKMLSMLAGLYIPIAVMDYGAVFNWPIMQIQKKQNKSIRIFPIGTTELAGQKVGQFLLELGHREIAFISAWWKNEMWITNRYEGLNKVISLAQVPGNVHRFVDQRYEVGTFQLDNEKLNKSILAIPSINQIIAENTPFSQDQVDAIASRLDWTFDNIIFCQKMDLFLQPLFEQALLEKNITAWVCADSGMAVAALRFLRKKGVAVPARISVAGYDDNSEAYSEGLTTFDYDIPGITQTMIAFISNPDLYPADKGIFIEKNGFLVPRQSTGPVRKE